MRRATISGCVFLQRTSSNTGEASLRVVTLRLYHFLNITPFFLTLILKRRSTKLLYDEAELLALSFTNCGAAMEVRLEQGASTTSGCCYSVMNNQSLRFSLGNKRITLRGAETNFFDFLGEKRNVLAPKTAVISGPGQCLRPPPHP